MYTFIISAILFLLLSGIIFGKRIKKNQLLVALIVFLGTFLTCVIVNGVIGLNTTYTLVKIREVPLKTKISSIKFMPKDSITMFKSYIDFDYLISKNDTICHIGVSGIKDIINTEHITINYITENDSIPIKRVFQPRKLVDNRWVVPFGLPRGKKIYKLLVPNDSINNEVLTLTKKYFFKNEES